MLPLGSVTPLVGIGLLVEDTEISEPSFVGQAEGRSAPDSFGGSDDVGRLVTIGLLWELSRLSEALEPSTVGDEDERRLSDRARVEGVEVSLRYESSCEKDVVIGEVAEDVGRKEAS